MILIIDIELKPYLESIKDLKLQVNHMNQVVHNLDEYTKKLGMLIKLFNN